jgi:hypothetical protein
MLRPRRVRIHLEALEDRTLPATLVGPTTLTYQDIDGDMVRVSFSKPVLTADNVNDIFQFNVGTVSGSNAIKQKLMVLSTVALDADSANRLNITVQVQTKALHGDGLANVGQLISQQQSLGKVIVQGDLGEFNLSSPGPGLATIQLLQANSLGRLGPQGDEMFLSSTSIGYIDTLRVSGGMAGEVRSHLYDGDLGTFDIGTLDIGKNFLGHLETDQGIGAVKVGGNIDGTNRAKAFVEATNAPGFMKVGISDGGTINQLTVDGSVLGGIDDQSGSLLSDDMFINHPTASNYTIRGSIVGSAGSHSGYVSCGATLTSFKILGGVEGGDGFFSGQVLIYSSSSLDIAGSIIGSHGEDSGEVYVAHANVNVGGNVIGGDGLGGSIDESGYGNQLSPVNITIRGGVRGGAVYSSVPVATAIIGPIIAATSQGGGGSVILTAGSQRTTILGSIVGGTLNIGGLEPPANQLLYISGNVQGDDGDFSGNVEIDGPSSQIRIDGSVIGGAGWQSGFMSASASLLSIGGSLVGGAGGNSGSISGSFDRITIGGSILGGAGENSGWANVGLVANLFIAGNISGGSGDTSGYFLAESITSASVGGSITGGAGLDSGILESYSNIESVTVGHDLVGGSGDYSGAIRAEADVGTEGSIDNAWIGGSILSGSIGTDGYLGTVRVSKSIMGTADHPSLIYAGGFAEDFDIHPITLGSLIVGQDMTFTNIWVGIDGGFDGVIRVGAISIGRNWSNSNLVVGFGQGSDFQFNTDDDIQWNPYQPSVVDSLVIQGRIMNAPGTVDTYYLLTGQFNSVFVNGRQVALQPGAGNDFFLLAPHLQLHEQFHPFPF